MIGQDVWSNENKRRCAACGRGKGDATVGSGAVLSEEKKDAGDAQRKSQPKLGDQSIYLSGNDVSSRGLSHTRSLHLPHLSPSPPPQRWTPLGYARSTPRSLRMKCSTSLPASSRSATPTSSVFGLLIVSLHLCSGISTDTPGRVDKQRVLQSLQAHGESYDRAREVLKHVSVDSSGKVELDDWVEVRTIPSKSLQSRKTHHSLVIVVERKASQSDQGGSASLTSREGHGARLERER